MFEPFLRQSAIDSPRSGIGEVRAYGRGKQGLIPLWVGEGDEPTPGFINDAAIKSLNDGETFYNYSGGIPDLREAMARYSSKLYGKDLKADRFFVTSSGMLALQTVFMMIAGAGDEVIVPSPAWPNSAACVGVNGAKPVYVPMPFGDKGFSFDLNRIEAAITPNTKAIFINSPSNPMGTVLSLPELQSILEMARKHNIWIIADEIYTRFYWKTGEFRAPSFHDIKQDDDKVIFINTFSKNWAMTGWRLGWIEADPSLGTIIENIIQYTTSGSPQFIQRAGVVAMDQGEHVILAQKAKAFAARTVLLEALNSTGRVKMASPDGAFYLFFTIDGVKDTRKLAFDLIDNAGIGLAPGTAFGEGGEDFMRLCYLRDIKSIETTAHRLVKAIKSM